MTMQRDRARRLFQAGIVALAASFAVAGYLACSGNAAAPTDAGVDLAHRSSGQIITPPGLGRVVTSGGILAGSGTTSNPLTATLSVSGAITGTGSAGSPLTSSSTVSTTAPVSGTGSAGSPIAITTNGISNTLIRQSVGVSIIGRSANSTGNVADIVAGADGQVLARASGTLIFTDISSLVATLAPRGNYGDGSDGALHFDGSSTITLGANNDGATLVPSANVYTLVRDLYATTLVIDSGVTVKGAGFFIFASVSANGPGTFSCDGNNGGNGSTTTGVAGGNTGTNRYSLIAGSGGAGATGNGATPVNGQTQNPEKSAGVGAANGGAGNFPHGGGSGGNGATGLGAQGGSVSGGGTGGIPTWKNSPTVISRNNLTISNGAGGGGGGGVAGFSGGGGGGGGCILGLFTPSIIGPITMSAKGGNGGDGNAGGNTGGGGGGGGGWVVDDCMIGRSNLTTNVSGGTAGAAHGTGHAGGNGAAGTVTHL